MGGVNQFLPVPGGTSGASRTGSNRFGHNQATPPVTSSRWRVVPHTPWLRPLILLLHKLNDKSIHDSPELSETFNSHFATIGPKLANNISQNSNSSYLNYLWKTNNTFDLSPTNYSKVFKILFKLCKTKATGLDKILARFLKECLDLTTASLCSIFNRSITSGIFPEEWKCAKVTPLFKNGQRSDLNNYRPIPS